VVPAPDQGWVTLCLPRGGAQRLAGLALWKDMTRRALAAAGVPEDLGAARVKVEVRVKGQGVDGIRAAEDVRTTWHAVREQLSAHLIDVVAERLELGVPAGEAAGRGYLVLLLVGVEVDRG